MSVLSRTQLRQLTGLRAEATVSLYMPVEPTFARLQSNLARLDRLVFESERLLKARDVAASTIERLIEPFRQLHEHELFWCATGDGLAAFSSPQWFRAYRVPCWVPEQICVNQQFHVAPLLPLLEAGGRFYILALHDDSARLYEASEQSIQQISLPLQLVAETESLTRVHLSANGLKQRACEFCRDVSLAVKDVLRGQDAPLVLACTGFLAQLYQMYNQYENLLKTKVPGNPSLWSLDELRRHGWELAAPVFRQQRDRALQLFNEALGSNRAACNVDEVIEAANQGRIHTLLVSKQARAAYGAMPSGNGVTSENGNAVDLAVTQTIYHGGVVLGVDQISINNSPVAALLRS